MSYMKIKIKETVKIGSIKNRNFSIRKGQIISVPSDTKIDRNVFDILEKNGKILMKIDKLLDVNIERLLRTGDEQQIIDELKKIDASYNDITLVLQTEAKNRKRKILLEYLINIPPPTDIGIAFSKTSVWIQELLHIKEISLKMARNIITVFPIKEDLIKAFDDGRVIPFESEIEDALRKKYNAYKKKNVISKSELQKKRLEFTKKQNVGATTTENFKFIDKKNEAISDEIGSD